MNQPDLLPKGPHDSNELVESEYFKSRKIVDREDAYHSRRFIDRNDKPDSTSEEVEDEQQNERLQIELAKPVEAIENPWVAPTPKISAGESSNSLVAATPRISRWDVATPDVGNPSRKTKSRWDETPMHPSQIDGGSAMSVDVASAVSIPVATSSFASMSRAERDLAERNRPWADSDLTDDLFPPGFVVLERPASLGPIPPRKNRSLTTTTTTTTTTTNDVLATPLYSIPQELSTQRYDIPPSPAVGLPGVKAEEAHLFKPVLEEVDEEYMTPEELKSKRIMRLLLKIKNGTPAMRKQALRNITDKARDFGPGPLFNCILPLLMSPALEDQERHLLVKVIDRVLFRLDDLVRPYVHKILVVIEPLLIDEDYYARMEGREIISNLSKAAGLATMIATMRPDIDNPEDYVRNTTARAFAVVASALGIPAILPFLRAVCKSRKSWEARHTGMKVIQQISIQMGCAVLPHLPTMVEIVAHGLEDENIKTRSMTALALAACAEASAPYGIEAFDTVLRPLFVGIRKHRGKVLAAFLKAIGYIIPLMDPEYADYCTREVMIILLNEFRSPDEEMKKIVLKIVRQCVLTDGVSAEYIKNDVLPDFFKYFWVRRMALEKRNYREVVDTTLALSEKVGVRILIESLANHLKDDSEPFRKMAMECIDKMVSTHGSTDIDPRLEMRLVDGLIHAFQEQSIDDASSQIILNGFGTVISSLGLRAAPYLQQIMSILKWRFNNKSARVRMMAADCVSQIAHVVAECGMEEHLANLGQVLFEYLGEEFPEVLGSILNALKAVVSVIGMRNMNPPIKDLLPRLTPILRNRHEKVQENVIDLVGRIADRGAEFVSAREWMRICFELLDLLKAHKKSIRRAAVNTFGYIAKAVGPQDVLTTLLNNLKVQERQNRVCTTVAIAIVAETCAPFTVLPALMNEYRVPELNVQNGVLKSLSFLFEYIGEMGKDYVYAIVPLLEDALMDRDLVHRQTACAVIKHMSLGIVGLGAEDAFQHLLNYVWPNIFETSPHVINAVMEAIEAMRMVLGAPRILLYVLQGLFHPARKVRRVYWRIYNSIYVGAGPALVSAYPQLEDDEFNTYARSELDLCF